MLYIDLTAIVELVEALDIQRQELQMPLSILNFLVLGDIPELTLHLTLIWDLDFLCLSNITLFLRSVLEGFFQIMLIQCNLTESSSGMYLRIALSLYALTYAS